MEIYGNAPNVLEMTYHRGTPDHHHEQDATTTLPSPSDFSEEYHIYGCAISHQAITWYLDGVEQWSFTNQPEISQLKPLYLVCNLAIGGVSGDPSENTWPQTYAVDYIRAWVRSELHDESGTRPDHS
jgi:beta-glucanase (GH16 family)